MSKKTNAIASLRSNPTLALLVGILAVSLSAVVLSVFKIQQNNSNIQRFLKESDDLRSANYRLVDALRASMDGNELSFDEMNETLTDMTDLAGELNGAKNKQLLDAMPAQIASVRDVWDKFKLKTRQQYCLFMTWQAV